MSKPALRLVESTEPTLDRLIQAFLEAKASRKKTTWKFYELPLRQFRNHVGASAWPPTDILINSYLATCRRRGLKQNTLYAYYRAIKTWLSWLHKRRLIETNPIELVEKQQPAGKLPRAPRLKIVQALSLEDWLEIRSTLPLQANLQSLFVSYNFNLGEWRDFSAGGIREAKDRYFERIGIPAFRLHDLRHAYAIYSLRNGGDLLDVQAQLGHKNISTTAIYLRALNDERGKRHEGSSPLTNL